MLQNEVTIDMERWQYISDKLRYWENEAKYLEKKMQNLFGTYNIDELKNVYRQLRYWNKEMDKFKGELVAGDNIIY